MRGHDHRWSGRSSAPRASRSRGRCAGVRPAACDPGDVRERSLRLALCSPPAEPPPRAVPPRPMRRRRAGALQARRPLRRAGAGGPAARRGASRRRDRRGLAAPARAGRRVSPLPRLGRARAVRRSALRALPRDHGRRGRALSRGGAPAREPLAAVARGRRVACPDRRGDRAAGTARARGRGHRAARSRPPHPRGLPATALRAVRPGSRPDGRAAGARRSPSSRRTTSTRRCSCRRSTASTPASSSGSPSASRSCAEGPESIGHDGLAAHAAVARTERVHALLRALLRPRGRAAGGASERARAARTARG